MSLAGLNEKVAKIQLDLTLMPLFSNGLQPQESSLFQLVVRFKVKVAQNLASWIGPVPAGG